MLVMDDASIHKIDTVKDKIKNSNKNKYDSWWNTKYLHLLMYPLTNHSRMSWRSTLNIVKILRQG